MVDKDQTLIVQRKAVGEQTAVPHRHFLALDRSSPAPMNILRPEGFIDQSFTCGNGIGDIRSDRIDHIGHSFLNSRNFQCVPHLYLSRETLQLFLTPSREAMSLIRRSRRAEEPHGVIVENLPFLLLR